MCQALYICNFKKVTKFTKNFKTIKYKANSFKPIPSETEARVLSTTPRSLSSPIFQSMYSGAGGQGIIKMTIQCGKCFESLTKKKRFTFY